MDILAQKRMLCVITAAVAVVIVCPALGAREEINVPFDRIDTVIASRALNADGGYFKSFSGYGFSSVEYFEHLSVIADKQADMSPEELWSETGLFPGGRIDNYYPPGPVLDFLENPTIESGRRYQRWNELRLDKITRAEQVLELLKQIEDEKAGSHAPGRGRGNTGL